MSARSAVGRVSLRLDVEVGHPQFGRTVPCECQERERAATRYSDQRSLSNLDHFVDCTFATFDKDVPGTREAFIQAKQYSETYEPIWIVLFGGYGTGKTHLAAAIANEAVRQQMTVLFARRARSARPAARRVRPEERRHLR